MAARAIASVTRSLGAVPLFSGCSQRELSKLARLGTLVHTAPGAVLTQEGKPGREFVLLMDGTAHCTIKGRLVATYQAGDFFGELSLLDGGPRTATIVMESPGELLVLDRGEFYRLLDITPSIVKKLLVELASRQRTTTNVLPTA